MACREKPFETQRCTAVIFRASWTVRHVSAQHSTARQGMARHGHGREWHDTAWHGMARTGMAQHGMAQHGTAWHGTAQAWHGMAWHGMTWHGMGRGMAWHSTEQLSKAPNVPTRWTRRSHLAVTAAASASLGLAASNEHTFAAPSPVVHVHAAHVHAAHGDAAQDHAWQDNAVLRELQQVHAAACSDV
eukprot:12274-Chlamydomonas_euryale.AAC.2